MYVKTIGNLTYKICDGYAVVTECDEDATSVVIPEKVDGKLITKIGVSAFNECESLKSITIPDSVTEIEHGAFAECTSLTEIIIPNSVMRIGYDAFGWCESLTEITIPNSVTEIAFSTFQGCASLKSITIPDSVTKIGKCAFKSCISLTEISIPNSVTEIDSWAFCNCTSLRDITIPESVKRMGNYVFLNCTSLAKKEKPKLANSTGNYILKNCTSAKKKNDRDKTVCNLKYRTYIPWGWIAIPFCTLDFMGEDENTYFNQWRKIRFAKYEKNEKKIKALNEKIKELSAEIKNLEDDRSFIEKLFSIEKSPNSLKKKQIQYDIFRASKEIEELVDDKFYDTSTLVSKAKSFLKANGFIIKSQTVSGEGLITHYEIWEK